jgi:hypothetical protein
MGGLPMELRSCWDIIGSPICVLVNSSNEGLLFTDPSILTEVQANVWISDNFPYATNSVISQIKDFYPIAWQSNGRYYTEFDRIKDIISGFFCYLTPILTIRRTNKLQRLVSRSRLQ